MFGIIPFHSISYGVRLPKFLLKKSKAELANSFLSKNTDITCSVRVLLREWPRNFLTPGQRDLERSCSYIKLAYHISTHNSMTVICDMCDMYELERSLGMFVPFTAI